MSREAIRLAREALSTLVSAQEKMLAGTASEGWAGYENGDGEDAGTAFQVAVVEARTAIATLDASLATQQEVPIEAAQTSADYEAHQANGLAWAVSCWHAEVAQRPLVNVHRRTLDDTWRQVIRYFGGDPDKLLGPNHDTLHMRAQEERAWKP